MSLLGRHGPLFSVPRCRPRRQVRTVQQARQSQNECVAVWRAGVVNVEGQCGSQYRAAILHVASKAAPRSTPAGGPARRRRAASHCTTVDHTSVPVDLLLQLYR
eukprot:COSAG05_NODE_280_length_12288_cov_4.797933_22_plen_104_part_00